MLRVRTRREAHDRGSSTLECTVTRSYDHDLTYVYQTWSVFSRHSPSTSTPVNDDPVRDAADPSPVADDDDVMFVTEVSAPAVNDAAPPAPRAFAADAAGSSPLSVAGGGAPATDATHVTLRDLLQSQETTVNLDGIAAFKKSTGFRKKADSRESHLLYLMFAALFLGGQLKLCVGEMAIFANALEEASRRETFVWYASPDKYANASDINIAVIQSDGKLVKYKCNRSGAWPWVVLARNRYGGSENDSEDWGAVLARPDWTAVWFPSHVWFEANLRPHRDLSDAEKAACEAVSVAASKRARDKARELEMLPVDEFEKKRLRPTEFYAAAENPTSASQGYCTDLPSLSGLMLPMMERSKGQGGGTLYLLAESGDFKDKKQCYVAVVLLNGNLVTLTFKTQGSAKDILLPLRERGARALTRTDNTYNATRTNSDMMFPLTSGGKKIRERTLENQHRDYDPDVASEKAQKQGKNDKKKVVRVKRKRAEPGSSAALLHEASLAKWAADADEARRRGDEERTKLLNELVEANSALKEYVEKLEGKREARRLSLEELAKLKGDLINPSTRFPTYTMAGVPRSRDHDLYDLSFVEMCTSDKIAEMYIAASKYAFGEPGAMHEAKSRVKSLGRGIHLAEHAILVNFVDLKSVEDIGGGQNERHSVERFLQASAFRIVQEKIDKEKKKGARPESRLLFERGYKQAIGTGTWLKTETARYKKFGLDLNKVEHKDAASVLRILEHKATFGGTVMAVLFPTEHAGWDPNSSHEKPNLGVDYCPDGTQARIAHPR